MKLFPFLLFLFYCFLITNAKFPSPSSPIITNQFNPGYLYCLSSSKELLDFSLIQSTFYYDNTFHSYPKHSFKAIWLISVCNECPCFLLKNLTITDTLSTVYHLDYQTIEHNNPHSPETTNPLDPLSIISPFQLLDNTMDNYLASGNCGSIDKCSPDLVCASFKLTQYLSYIERTECDSIMCHPTNITNSIHSSAQICSTPESDKMLAINAKYNNNNDISLLKEVNRLGNCPTCTSCSNSQDYFQVPSFKDQKTETINAKLICEQLPCSIHKNCSTVRCSYTFQNPFTTAFSFFIHPSMIPTNPPYSPSPIVFFDSLQCTDINHCYVDGSDVDGSGTFKAIWEYCIPLDDKPINITFSVISSTLFTVCDNYISIINPIQKLTLSAHEQLVTLSPSPLTIDCTCNNPTLFTVHIDTLSKCTCISGFTMILSSPLILEIESTPNIICEQLDNNDWLCYNNTSNPIQEDLMVIMSTECPDNYFIQCPDPTSLSIITNFNYCNSIYPEATETDILPINYDCGCDNCVCTINTTVSSGSQNYLEIDMADQSVGIIECVVLDMDNVMVGLFIHTNRWDAYKPISIEQYSRLPVSFNQSYTLYCCSSTLETNPLLIDNCLNTNLPWNCNQDSQTIKKGGKNNSGQKNNKSIKKRGKNKPLNQLITRKKYSKSIRNLYNKELLEIRKGN